MAWICDQVMPVVQRRKLARFADFCLDDRLWSVSDANCYLQTVRHLGFPLKIHATEDRVDEAVRLAVTMDAISLDHLEQASQRDMELLASSNTIAVLLPGPPFHLGGGHHASARKLIDAGVPVAAATNFNPCTCPTYNMQMIIALACTRLAMTPAEAVCATTFNAACAIGREHEAGSLEIGKFGDVIILEAGDYREIPCHFGVNLVRMTLKRGVVIYEQGKIVRPERIN
jgi:imidazolonepropionase